MRQFQPKSTYESENLILRQQKGFGAGALGDIDASKIPLNGVKYSKNYRLYADRAEPRGGSKKWSTTGIPAISGRTGYSVSKSGNTITKTAGTNFTSADVGSFFVHDDGKHERITAAPTTATISVDTLTAHADSTAGYVRAKTNGLWVHDKKGYLILHTGTCLYYSASVTTITWVAIPRTGRYDIGNPTNGSTMIEMKDYVIIADGSRIFKIDFSASAPYYMQINIPCPATLITGVAQTALKPYGRRYLSSYSRLSGTLTQDRLTATVIQQTGPTTPNSSRIDYGEVFTTKRVGPAITTIGILTGDTLAAAYDTPAELAAFNNVQYRLTVNGTSGNVTCDFTGIKDFTEAAAEMQTEMGITFPEANITVTYSNSPGGHFIITSPNEGGTITTATAGDAGTDGSVALSLAAPGAVVTTPTYSVNSCIGDLMVNADLLSDKSMTHFTLWATQDTGPNGVDPNTGSANNLERYGWVADIPMTKCFRMAVDAAGAITMQSGHGSIEAEDIGCNLYFPFAGKLKRISTLTALVNSDGTAYSGGAITLANGSAFLCSQTAVSQPLECAEGYVTAGALTCTQMASISGSGLTSDVVGSTVFFDDGTTAILTAISDSTHGTISPASTIGTVGAVVAFSFRPYARNFNDTITDETILSRFAGFSLPNRFHQPMPTADLIAFSGELMMTADEDDVYAYYCQVPALEEYLAGYCNLQKQVLLFKDKVKELIARIDQITVRCVHYSYSISTSTLITETIDEIGEVTIIIATQSELSSGIGTRDRGATRALSTKDGPEMVFTNEPAMRLFNGSSYSKENFAFDRIMIELNKLVKGMSSSYDLENGYILWGLDDSTLSGQTNRSFRFGVEKNQAIGWMENTGADFPMPEPHTGTVLVYDANGDYHQLVLDWKDGLLYDISTRKGPASSGLVFCNKDKMGTDGLTGGTQIAPYLYLREDEGSFEHQTIQNDTDYLYVRELDPTVKSETGDDGTVYDAYGFPTALKIAVDVYKDGEPTTVSAHTDAIKITGETAYDGVIESRRLQKVISANMGYHKIVGFDRYYKNVDRPPDPDQGLTKEDDYQTLLCSPQLWADMKFAALINRVTGGAIAGAITAITGPDAYSNSAFQIGNGVSLNLGNVALTGGLGAIIFAYQGSPSVYIADVAVSYTVLATYSSWKYAYVEALTRTGMLRITASGTVKLFDVRAYNSALGTDAITYWMNDIRNKNGSNVLVRE